MSIFDTDIERVTAKTFIESHLLFRISEKQPDGNIRTEVPKRVNADKYYQAYGGSSRRICLDDQLRVTTMLSIGSIAIHVDEIPSSVVFAPNWDFIDIYTEAEEITVRGVEVAGNIRIQGPNLRKLVLPDFKKVERSRFQNCIDIIGENFERLVVKDGADICRMNINSRSPIKFDGKFHVEILSLQTDCWDKTYYTLPMCRRVGTHRGIRMDNTHSAVKKAIGADIRFLYRKYWGKDDVTLR